MIIGGKRKMDNSKTIVITVPQGNSNVTIPSGLLQTFQQVPKNGIRTIPFSSLSVPSGMILPKSEICEMTLLSHNIENIEEPERKRQRLDHLSLEEKINRRKMKNRVAAQTARDRKKTRMDELEKELEEMRQLQEAYKIQNAELLKENETLHEQNICLRALLSEHNAERSTEEFTEEKHQPMDIQREEQVEETSDEIPIDTVPLESAALISDPLQKGQETQNQLAVLKMLLFLSTYLCGQSMLQIVKTAWNTSSVSQMNLMDEREEKKIVPSHVPFSQEWWGPHQNSWNPAKK